MHFRTSRACSASFKHWNVVGFESCKRVYVGMCWKLGPSMLIPSCFLAGDFAAWASKCEDILLHFSRQPFFLDRTFEERWKQTWNFHGTCVKEDEDLFWHHKVLRDVSFTWNPEMKLEHFYAGGSRKNPIVISQFWSFLSAFSLLLPTVQADFIIHTCATCRPKRWGMFC